MAIKNLSIAAAVLLGIAPAASADESVGSFILKVLGLGEKSGAQSAEAPPAAAQLAGASPRCEIPGAVATRGGVTIKGTHTEQEILAIDDDQGSRTQLHTFCLDRQGRILAGCGAPDQGEVRVLDGDGKYLATWPLPVVPEAISVDPQGRVYVAGEGKLLKLDDKGNVLVKADAPHVAEMIANRDEMKKQIIERHKTRSISYERTLKVYEEQIDKLKKKREEQGELSEAEQKRLEVYERARRTMAKFVEQQKSRAAESEELDEEEVERQVKAMLAYKSKVSSISSTGEEVFMATGMATGYGYQVYKMTGEFKDAESIISSLRGCCGQMDVQACEAGVFVAENSRHRVARFDRDGAEVNSWGSRDRTGENGFSSCCNPMNVCFGPNGSVLTAESTTGHIKQFDAEGKLLAHIGVVKLVPGCKKVSIAASADGNNVYMMDITRTHIVKLSRGAAEEPREAAGGGE